MTEKEIKEYREKLANISDEDIERIVDIIKPYICPDPDQPIIDSWKIWDSNGVFTKEEDTFADKVGLKDSYAKCFYAGWKACEQHYKETKK